MITWQRTMAAATMLWALQATDASAQEHGAMHRATAGAATDCTATTLACASAATPFVDARHRLWVAWSANGTVSLAHSDDLGKNFSAAVVIGRHGATLDVGADARPQVAVDPRGHVVVAYGVFKDKRYNAQVLVSTSVDGTTFSAPRSLSADAASQRFPVVAFEDDGMLFAAWLDKRTVAAAKRGGTEQPGAAIAYATSRDGGEHFGDERIAEDHSCECCHLAVAFDRKRHPAVLYRAIYGRNVRDHAVTTFGDDGAPGAPHRVAVDDWAIDGCPHHGPALAIAADGSYQAAWFTQGAARRGLFVARSADGGATFSTPQPVGDPTRQPGRPQLLAVGTTVWLAWKEFDGKSISIRARVSKDAGRTWSPDRLVGETDGPADHPLLVADGDRAFVSWATRAQGYRLIELDRP